MIPRIAKGGRSFKGAYAYFGHDKQQATKQRVEWTHTENMLTEDPDKAWKVMAYTVYEQGRLKEASGQKATGRKLQKPVFSYSLAWHPEQNPDREHMLATAKKSVVALGFTEHEMLIVAHRDEPQRHVHIIVNRVHPITGIAADLTNSKEKLSDFAHAYEVEDGKVYCKQREENVEKRKAGKETRYADPDLVRAWNKAADGKAFIQALKDKGFHLAQGRKRIVLVDKFGKISNPTRQLPGVKAKDLKAKLGDLNLHALFDAASLSAQIQKKEKTKYDDRQKEMAKTISPPVMKPEKSPTFAHTVPTKEQRVQPTPEAQNRLQSRHLDERAKHFAHYQTLLENEQERLHGHYQIKERQQAMKALSEKTANPSWWRKIRGHAKQNLLELRDMKRNYRNVQGRITEQMGFWEKERDRTAKVLTDRHANEKAWLFEKGVELQQARAIPNPAKKKERDLDHDR
jgi:hypothetical protein